MTEQILSTNGEWYILVFDNDGHEFAIDKDLMPAFNQYLSDMENNGYSNGYDFEKHRIEGTLEFKGEYIG